MPYTQNAVVLDAFSFEDFTFTRLISGAVTAADVGKALAIDNTAAGTVKIAADGDMVYGRLYQFEDRLQEGVKVATVERKFIKRLPKTAAAITVGVNVVGGGAGQVKALAATVGQETNTVLLVDTTANAAAGYPNGYVVVEKL